MITLNELEEMKNVDFKNANIDDLVDIRDVKIDTSKPKYEKIFDFIEQIKNPYLFKVGNTIVKLTFPEGNNIPTFEEKFNKLLINSLNQ